MLTGSTATRRTFRLAGLLPLALALATCARNFESPRVPAYPTVAPATPLPTPTPAPRVKWYYQSEKGRVCAAQCQIGYEECHRHCLETQTLSEALGADKFDSIMNASGCINSCGRQEGYCFSGCPDLVPQIEGPGG